MFSRPRTRGRSVSSTGAVATTSWSLLFLLLATPPGFTQQRLEGKRIVKISIEGLNRVSEARLLAQMRVRIGDQYDPKTVSDETGRLYQAGNFDRVLDPIVREFEDGVEIIFRVEEKPRIRRVIFDAVDVESHKTSIGEKTLSEAITTRANGLLSRYMLRLDASQIVQSYGEKGYLFCEVDHAVRPVEGAVEVIFLIKEGPRVLIQEIRFSGNKTVSSGTLESLMVTKERDFFFGFINPGYYDQAELDRDVKNLTDYYQSLGFFDVLVAVDDLDFEDQNETLRVGILIEEGPRYIFEGYQFEGNKVFSTQTLRTLVSEKPGGFFSAERVNNDRNEILDYYKDRAYIDATVRWRTVFHQEDSALGVLVFFDIEENQEIYIDRVNVVGNLKTQDRVVRRELEFYPGEKFNWSKLEKSRSNLARLQIFQDVEYELVRTAENRKNVLVKVTEQPTGRLLLGFGVTSGFGVIGNFAVTKRNFDFTDLPDSIYDIPDSFTGAGQTLNIVLQPGSQRSLYQFSFTEPYLFESRNSMTLEGSAITIIRRDFDEDRISFRPRLGRAFDFDRDLIFSIGARLEEVEITDIDSDAADDVFAAAGHTSIVATNATLLYDKVLQEPLEGPYSGHRERLFYEYGGEPLGGQVDLSKVESSLELYFPIFVHEEDRLHHVISLSSRFGLIEGHHDTESIPIFERFFLGGPNTVRGFRFRGLGPHERGEALGGTAAWYGSAEYVFPLFQKFVRGVLFLDYGNLAREQTQFRLSKMRFTLGGGVRINFPFLGTPLPVGLYLGQPIRKEDEDRTRFFLFTIGAPF